MNAITTIHEVFFKVAAAAPEKIALVCGDQTLTYGDLAQRASDFELHLRRLGVVDGDLVGMFMQRSPHALVAMLGILKAGAAYVPFDTSYPYGLLRQLYDDAAPSLMLVNTSDTAILRPFWSGPVVDMGTLLREPLEVPLSAETPNGGHGRLCYVMYTSGSTGRSKGVAVSHRAVLRLVLNNDFVHLDAYETLLHMAPLSFDASTFEIWGALLNGATLAILPSPHPSLADIALAINRHHVTTLWLTAGLFNLMVDHCLEGLAPVRQLLAGGDVLSTSHVGKALRALPHCRLINGYGPTENTTFTCCYTIPPDVDLSVPLPIGKPIAQTRIYIVDGALQPVMPGEPGELCAAGAGLAEGYLHQPELTREKFVHNPFDPAPGALMYRTGDRVRQRADGNIEFLGRTDRQVKINGKRVELDAVEARLRNCSLIADAAVVSHQSGTQRRITAYIVPLPGTTVDLDELRRYSRSEIPDHMVPSMFVILDALPLSATGKIDRAAMPQASPALAPIQSPGAAPTDDVQRALIAIWCKVLGTNAVGMDDNFFDLGGTSLSLIQMHAAIQATLNSDISLAELFEYPRIRSLSVRLSGGDLPREPVRSQTARALLQQAALERARHANGAQAS